MLTFFRDHVLAYLVYASVLSATLIGVAKRPLIPLVLLLVLTPLPTFWYPTHQWPLGTQTIDLLFISGMVGGIFAIRGHPAPPPPRLAFLFAYAIFTYLSLWQSSIGYGLPIPLTGDNPILADWKNYVLLTFFYLLAYYAVHSERQVRIIVSVAVGVLLFMVWREFTGFVAGSSFSYSRRANGAFWMVGLNANHFGAFIAHYGALALGMWAVLDAKWARRLLLLTVLLCLYPLFYSYSRGAYLAALVAIAFVGLVRKRSLIIGLAVLLIFWTVLLPASVVDRIQMTDSGGGELEESAALRLVVWDLAERLFSESPLTGIGFNGFYFASADLPLHNVHNFYLQIAAEQGVIGILFLAYLLFSALKSGWRLYRKGSSNYLRAFGFGFTACTLAVMTTNVFGDRFSQIALGAYFFILLGIADRALAIDRQSSMSAPVKELASPSTI